MHGIFSAVRWRWWVSGNSQTNTRCNNMSLMTVDGQWFNWVRSSFRIKDCFYFVCASMFSNFFGTVASSTFTGNVHRHCIPSVLVSVFKVDEKLRTWIPEKETKWLSIRESSGKYTRTRTPNLPTRARCKPAGTIRCTAYVSFRQIAILCSVHLKSHVLYRYYTFY